jgi:diguanylate cyclase (GGDEF)-like protein
VIENARTRTNLQYSCLALFLSALFLIRRFDNPFSLGLLFGVPPLAAFAWSATWAGVITFVVYGFFALTLAFSLEGHRLVGLAMTLAMGVIAWILRNDSSAEVQAQHAERQLLEDLQDECAGLQQEIKAAEGSVAQHQNRRQQYGLLTEAARLLGTTLSLEELAGLVLEQAGQLLPGRDASFTLFIFGRDGKEVLRRQQGPLTYPEDQACADDKLNGWALSQGSPLLIRDLSKDFRFKGLKLGALPSKCFMISPLVLGGKATGLLRAEAPAADAFDTEDQRLLETLTGFALLALENAKLYGETEALAVTDGLTGLLLRRTLLERLEEEMKRSAKTGLPLAFLLMDLDHFKAVNDAHGHPAGDQVLREVANLFKGSLRDTDFCGRYGGEEFGVILSGTDLGGAHVVAERMRKAVAGKAIDLEGIQVSMTVSLGIALYPAHAASLQPLIERADEALYLAKQAGRNRVVAYESPS